MGIHIWVFQVPSLRHSLDPQSHWDTCKQHKVNYQEDTISATTYTFYINTIFRYMCFLNYILGHANYHNDDNELI